MSVFAIVILSVIGALFKSNHHSMMGSTEDPKDGAAVAVTVFSAVIVYAVGLLESERLWLWSDPIPRYFWLAAVSKHICTSAIVEEAP